MEFEVDYSVTLTLTDAPDLGMPTEAEIRAALLAQASTWIARDVDLLDVTVERL